MKLIRPTDDELNAAFAEKVCNWSKGDDGYGYETVYNERVAPYKTVGPVWRFNFARSADAVLPWLEKCYMETDWLGGPVRHYTDAGGGACWRVRLPGKFDGEVEDNSLPRACVIALLRAHGVEVEL